MIRKRQHLGKLQNKAWVRAYYYAGYNPKTNKISMRLRGLRNRKKTW